MKVVDIRHVEECANGDAIREYVFDESISRPLIEALMTWAAQSQYFASLPRPFFRLETPGKFVLKGVEGGRSMRITLQGVMKQQTEMEFVFRIGGVSVCQHDHVREAGRMHGE